MKYRNDLKIEFILDNIEGDYKKKNLIIPVLES
jgi:hypothetical protein